MFEHTHFVAVSGNSKTGPIPVTYRNMEETCPHDCPFFNNGCYGVGRIEALTRKYSRTITVDHARSVLAKRKPTAKYLRDRVIGDLVTARGRFDMPYVRTIARIAREHALTVFGYTHAWRMLDRRAVSSIAASGYVLNASCETVADVRMAISLGMPAVITNDDVSEGMMIDGRRVVTCPAQTRDNVTCASCGLCAKPERKSVVRFLVHGPSKNRARRAIAARTGA